MAGVYSVEGKLGTGKSKFAVWRAQQALLDGRRVAGNVDLFLDKLVPKLRASYIRLPDKPTAFDLQAMGKGAEGGYDEDNFGILLLDELGTWLNARSFQDPERAKVLDWLIHARKNRWEVYLIVQDSGMIDKQVRQSLIEYECKCLRLDKVKIPFVGKLINDIAVSVLGRKKGRRWGYLPKLHTVAARVGQPPNQILAERWFYTGKQLHAGYDTEQQFRADYPHGAHTVLPPWDHRAGATFAERVAEWWRAVREGRPSRDARSAARDGCLSRLGRLLSELPVPDRWRHLKRLQRLGLMHAVWERRP